MKDLKEREKKITQTGIIGILANIGLATGKAIVGLIAGAVSVVLDAINNLSDAISSVITIIGIKLSEKKPTEKHPYGFGRIEYFSTIIIAAIILAGLVVAIILTVVVPMSNEGDKLLDKSTGMLVNQQVNMKPQ